MNTKELIKMECYKGVGLDVLNKTIKKEDKYAYVNIDMYSDELVLELAKDFLRSYNEEFEFYSPNRDENKLYKLMSDTVREYTKINENYYWNNWENRYCPREILVNALFELIKKKDKIKFKLKKGSGEHIEVYLENGDILYVSGTDKDYVIRNEVETLSVLNNKKDFMKEIDKLGSYGIFEKSVYLN